MLSKYCRNYTTQNDSFYSHLKNINRYGYINNYNKDVFLQWNDLYLIGTDNIPLYFKFVINTKSKSFKNLLYNDSIYTDLRSYSKKFLQETFGIKALRQRTRIPYIKINHRKIKKKLNKIPNFNITPFFKQKIKYKNRSHIKQPFSYFKVIDETHCNAINKMSEIKDYFDKNYPDIEFRYYREPYLLKYYYSGSITVSDPKNNYKQKFYEKYEIHCDEELNDEYLSQVLTNISYNDNFLFELENKIKIDYPQTNCIVCKHYFSYDSEYNILPIYGPATKYDIDNNYKSYYDTINEMKNLNNKNNVKIIAAISY